MAVTHTYFAGPAALWVHNTCDTFRLMDLPAELRVAILQQVVDNKEALNVRLASSGMREDLDTTKPDLLVRGLALDYLKDPKSIESNPRAMALLGNARVLDVSASRHWQPGKSSVTALNNLLSHTPNVRVLRLSSWYLKDDLAKVALDKLPKLRELNLKGGALRVEDLNGLPERAPKLEVLDLSDNPLGLKSNLLNPDVEGLFGGPWPTLKKLDLSRTQLGARGAEMLPGDKWPNLEVLNLSSNGLRDEGLRNFPYDKFHNLTSVNFGGNHIGDEGLKALQLDKMPHLVAIGLRGNPRANFEAWTLGRGYQLLE